MLGAHMPAAGGLHNALLSGAEIGCEAVQLFVKSPSQWRAKPLTEEAIKKFHEVREETGLDCLVCHDAYLINLASSDRTNLARSRRAILDELERCEELGIPYLVTHMGSHLGHGEDRGLVRLAKSVSWALERSNVVMVLLETMAGQGTNLGHQFEHIGQVMDAVGDSSRLGVCLDTCHVFSAGYDLRTPEVYEATWHKFEEVIGLEHLKVIHANDSKCEFGSRVDRHEHIGKGFLGRDAFKLLVNDHRLEKVPKIIETPDFREHRTNIRRLRRLMR